MTWRSGLLLGIGATIVIAVSLAGPIAQDLSYHEFSDQRQFADIPNFLNVISNLPFLFVGVWGLVFVAQHGDVVAPNMKTAWLVFFTGIALTTFGSGYFHLRPDNETLVWDRLPMTLGFMSLVAIIVAEYGSARVGKALLLPILLLGFASVLYWSYTESLGVGDLRPYAIVQFLPLLLIPVTLTLYHSRSDLGHYFWWMIAFYVAAKVLEQLDAEFYAAGNLISGHSLKHVVASMAPACALYGLMKRRAHG